MDSEYDIEKDDNGSQSETGVFLVLIVLIVSCAAHLGLMYACSSCQFAPLPDEVKGVRKQTHELPVMQMQTLAEDPLIAELNPEGRPAAAPDQEKQEERVDRLADAAGSSIAPEMPKAASTAPISDAAPEPAKVEAAEWKPRQEIAVVEAPIVPDEAAALPRLVIPKIERVAAAADIVPAFDLVRRPTSTSSSGSLGGGNGLQPTSLAAAADAAAAAAAAPAPAGIPSAISLGGRGPMGGQAPSLTVLSAAEEAAAKKAADEARAADTAARAAEKQREREAAATRPVPPAPTSTMVDEKVVAKEKEAVRVLRDETTLQGRPFEKHVKLGLGSWTDPADPAHKYFRITLSSHADQPLPVVSKDIVFLMDASGSIANDRLKKCRTAFMKALRLLNTGDRFNVVAFRDKFTFCFPDVAWKEVTDASLEAADDWLRKLTAHGQTDVFRTLRGVLAMPRDPARPVIAFVVTDGEATSGMTRSAEIVSKFSELNGGLISIYMYGVKDSANAYLMDMLTRCNRGGWSRNEKLRWNAADGIPELAKKFERPVLADISVLFTASSRAETYPRLVSNLCEDEPLTIYGKCPADQKELVFTMRGLNGADVYESLFRMPFGTSQALDASVKTEWAKRRLYALIAAYTAKPDNNLLKELRSFAQLHGIAVPYEKEMSR